MEVYRDPAQLVSHPEEILILILTDPKTEEFTSFRSDFASIQDKLDFLQIRWVVADLEENPELRSRFSVVQTPTFVCSTNNEWTTQIDGYKGLAQFVLSLTRTFTGC